ncbi:Hsp70 family protein [Dactylosporangium sucinum]|uniref:Hsp70 protein n=1 Tax=Dactylosporangium sucinum TaxID=1424081 RepID=A0A917TDE3_9ACTN|nr:Hsp70 family protein [Dactylosporangium sucinum]GGM19323.1 hypothetical protein GCM10007977_020720 [Dactylosporangium sucinum]
MPTPGIRLGVDFGTSNTVAVVRWPDGRSRPLLFDGSPLLPSAVYAEPDGTIVVGRDAVHSARREPARFEPNPKRRIDEGTVLLGDRELPVGELVAAVLRRVYDEWTRTVGGAPPDVTVTCPASWGATRRLVISDAAAAAGLGNVRMVPEPVAAAAYFTQVLGHDVPVGSVVVVHDFGAGTFDASVVARTAEGFEVLAVDGRDDIGGIDVDNAIVAHFGTICAPEAPEGWQRLMQPATIEDRRHRRMLWDDARVAKERLSRQPAADLNIPLLNRDVHLTREELERLAQPLIKQTVRVTQGVIRWSQLAQDRIAGVFLVGGSSRMPLVATLLHRELGNAPVAIEQPELVVAEGGTLAGFTATPASAAPPVPGPSTGLFPRLPGFDAPPPPPAQPPVGQPVSPVAVPAGPVSAPPSSGPPVAEPLWPDAPDITPVSGTPVSSGSSPAHPVSAPPPGGGGYSTPPPGNFAAPPVSAPPGAYAQGGPVSAPPATYGQPPMSAPPASGPPATYAPPPSSAPPASYSQPPASWGQPPSSAPPANPPRGGQTYRSGQQQPPKAGPVYQAGVASGRPVSPAVPPEPATRYDERGMPLRLDPEPVPTRIAQPAKPSRPAPREPYRRKRGPFARFMLGLFVTVLLVVTPLTAGYVAYYLTTDEWPPPVNGWIDSTGR